ncbi:protease modulator HflC, partial [Candidatus Thioglobus sp.]|nr:protease modulator HflC [Candidatus Thioglobus sp.]
MQKLGLIIIAAVFFILSTAVYTVSETETAIKLRLGEIVSVEKEPGLKFKTPFVNNVVKFDNRVQTLDAPS